MKFYKKLILEALGFKKWFYIVALLIIFVPIAIVMVSGVGFSDLFSKMFISIALILLVIGRALTACSRSKGDSRLYNDIAVIIALLLIIIFRLF
ncbi:MAG: hypothetical protein ACI33K_03485 [Clostridiaceae bacterium]